MDENQQHLRRVGAGIVVVLAIIVVVVIIATASNPTKTAPCANTRDGRHICGHALASYCKTLRHQFNGENLIFDCASVGVDIRG